MYCQFVNLSVRVSLCHLVCPLTSKNLRKLFLKHDTVIYRVLNNKSISTYINFIYSFIQPWSSYMYLVCISFCFFARADLINREGGAVL